MKLIGDNMDKLKQLEKRISLIERRNVKVEKDKAWETSFTRKILLVLFTYLTLAIYFKFVLQINPWLNAIVPTAGFFLSTLTLPFFKNIWEKYIHNKHEEK